MSHTLTQLIYDDDVSGPLRLYIFDSNGMHSGGKWFENQPKYPDEAITTPPEAKQTGRYGVDCRLRDPHYKQRRLASIPRR